MFLFNSIYSTWATIGPVNFQRKQAQITWVIRQQFHDAGDQLFISDRLHLKHPFSFRYRGGAV
jgi:hypothetical protein